MVLFILRAEIALHPFSPMSLALLDLHPLLAFFGGDDDDDDVVDLDQADDVGAYDDEEDDFLDEGDNDLSEVGDDDDDEY